MNIFIQPLRYVGEGRGITVRVGGLTSKIFDSISFSFDGGPAIYTNRNMSDKDFSLPVTYICFPPYHPCQVVATVVYQSVPYTTSTYIVPEQYDGSTFAPNTRGSGGVCEPPRLMDTYEVGEIVGDV